jgi:hypothetical protein
MTLRNLGMGIAGNLIAAAILWYVTGPNTGLVIGGAGIALFVIVYFFTKKPVAPILPSPPSPPVLQENRQSQEFSPRIDIHVAADTRNARIEEEEARQERLVLAYMKSTHPGMGYTIDEVAIGVKLTMPDAWDTLERMKAKRIVWTVQLNEAIQGVVYFLEDVYRQ